MDGSLVCPKQNLPSVATGIQYHAWPDAEFRLQSVYSTNLKEALTTQKGTRYVFSML